MWPTASPGVRPAGRRGRGRSRPRCSRVRRKPAKRIQTTTNRAEPTLELQWSRPETGGARRSLTREQRRCRRLQWSPPETGGARTRKADRVRGGPAAVESAGDRRSESSSSAARCRDRTAVVESAGDRRSEASGEDPPIVRCHCSLQWSPPKTGGASGAAGLLGGHRGSAAVESAEDRRSERLGATPGAFSPQRLQWSPPETGGARVPPRRSRSRSRRCSGVAGDRRSEVFVEVRPFSATACCSGVRRRPAERGQGPGNLVSAVMKLQWSPPETGGASKAVPEETVIRITLQWSPPETGGASRHRRPHAADDRTAAVEAAGDRRSEGPSSRSRVAAASLQWSPPETGGARSRISSISESSPGRCSGVRRRPARRGSTFQPVLIRRIGPSRERCVRIRSLRRQLPGLPRSHRH